MALASASICVSPMATTQPPLASEESSVYWPYLIAASVAIGPKYLFRYRGSLPGSTQNWA